MDLDVRVMRILELSASSRPGFPSAFIAICTAHQYLFNTHFNLVSIAPKSFYGGLRGPTSETVGLVLLPTRRASIHEITQHTLNVYMNRRMSRRIREAVQRLLCQLSVS